MSETLIHIGQHTDSETNKTYDVIYVEVERIERTDEDAMKIILEKYARDATAAEDAIQDMKEQGLL